jgi:hypothetical protein
MPPPDTFAFGASSARCRYIYPSPTLTYVRNGIGVEWGGCFALENNVVSHRLHAEHYAVFYQDRQHFLVPHFLHSPGVTFIPRQGGKLA